MSGQSRSRRSVQPEHPPKVRPIEPFRFGFCSFFSFHRRLRRRCELLISIGAHKELLRACLTMLRWAQPERGEEWVELATNIARIHHADGHLHSARKALANALHRCSHHFTMEHFNLLLELQVRLGGSCER